MKKIIILLLLCPLFSFAQDWHGVPVGQHNIYKVPVTGVDSLWNNYIRDMYVANQTVGTNGTTFHFYRSLRQDENEIYDTLTGPTWLGRSMFRGNNGDEIYLNKYLDTVRIKTTAALNQSWTLGHDTLGSKTFEATVISTDTMTIDGAIDSIKTISIQAKVGNTPVASVYNNYQIILSKAHGFITIFDLYGFPEYENSPPLYWPPMVDDIFPILPYEHHRLDSSILHIDFTDNDLSYQYQPGNYWMIERWRTGIFYPEYYFDSIISVTSYLPNAVIVDVLRKTLTWQYVQANPSFISTFTSAIVTDTIYKTPASQSIVLANQPNCEPYQSMTYTNQSPYRFLDTFCNGLNLLRDTSTLLTPLSGNYYKSRDYYQGLDIRIDIYTVQGQPNGQSYAADFAYYNFNGCQAGTYFTLQPLSVNNFYNRNNLFKIYPNPTSNSFYIETDEDWNSLEIMSIQGQRLRSFQPDQINNLSLMGLPSGLYILKVKTDKGNFLQKIMKE